MFVVLTVISACTIYNFHVLCPWALLNVLKSVTCGTSGFMLDGGPHLQNTCYLLLCSLNSDFQLPPGS